MIRSHLILSYIVSYLRILSHSSLDLCLVLCTLPPLMSYSLTLSSTMMSCTVHSPMDSLAQPTCILVYIEHNPAPGGSPFELSLGLHSNSRVLFLPSPQSLLVWWFILGLPWVASRFRSVVMTRFSRVVMTRFSTIVMCSVNYQKCVVSTIKCCIVFVV